MPGLEFLLEIDGDEFDSDDDFYTIDNSGERSDRQITDSLYVVMTNSEAVTELLTLFAGWQANPAAGFPYGLTPLRDVFALLRAVRPWGPEDRIRETGLVEKWREDVAVVGQTSTARVEIELWFRSDGADRVSAQNTVAAVVSSSGGTLLRSSVIPEIGYHALLADVPYGQVEQVVEQGPEAIALLTTDAIMFVSPALPMAAPTMEIADQAMVEVMDPPREPRPRVALLDGLPLAGHGALADRIVLDDPQGIADRYTAVSQRRHGTAMGSLIIHGDLNDPDAPLDRRIYVRPIMEPHPAYPQTEVILNDELLTDLIHQCFRRMFEGTPSLPPQAPSVRIVNLSIGQPIQMYVRRLSPLAKLLDWLAHRYNVLIMVSAGNHPVSVTVPSDILNDPDMLRRAVARDIYSRSRHRRLFSPAEAVNVVTVGAVHSDASEPPASDTVLDVTEFDMPALYSAVGLGYNRSIKPDVLLPGGRVLLQRSPYPPPSIDTVELHHAPTTASGPGLRVAAPGPQGSLQSTAYLYGTSNATALASRHADRIFDALEQLTNTPPTNDFPFPDEQYHPVLAKTLIVHAASWGQRYPNLVDLLHPDQTLTRRTASPLLGYGPIDPERSVSARTNRALLLGANSITAGQRHTFAFPLPPSLAATTEWRRLTITLAWLSPVNTRSRRHRVARLSFDPPCDALGAERVNADWQASRKGTVQHELLEGDAALAFAAGSALVINVDCRIDGATDIAVRYGIAATLELGATVQTDIHNEIRQQLQTRLRATIAAQR